MKRTVSVLLTALLFLTCLTPVFAVMGKVTLFGQNFDNNTTGLNQADFSLVQRPADDSVDYIAYTPDGTANGALLSNKDSTTKAKIDFGQNYTGQLVFEADFRLDGRAYTSSSGQIKIFDAFSSTGKNIFTITSGSCNANDFAFRPVYFNSAGVIQTTNLKVNNAYLPYKTWHRLKVVMATDTATTPGTISFYVNGFLVAEGFSRGGVSVGGFNDISYLTSYHSSAGLYPFLIDNVEVYQEMELSHEASLSSDVYSVTDSQVSGIVENSTVADVLGNVTLADYATADVYQTDGATLRKGIVQTGDIIKVTAQDGTTTKSYSLSVDQPSSIDFRQSFDYDISNVTLNGFSIVDERLNLYSPDGTKNGILKSDPTSTQKARITFDKNYSGNVVFTGKFRYDSQEAASSGIKFFDLYDDKGVCQLVFTIGGSSASGYQIRPVYKTEDGSRMDLPVGSYLPYGEWHTFQMELNGDTFSASVNGVPVVTDGHPWNEAAGTPATNLSYVESYHSAAHTKPFYLDEIQIQDLNPEGYEVTYSVGANGNLKRGEGIVPASETLQSGQYTYLAQAESGYEVSAVSVTSGGTTIYPTLDSEGSFSVTISADTEISVSFTEQAPTAPGFKVEDNIQVNKSMITDTEGKTFYAYTVYASMIHPDLISAYGMKLTSGENEMILPGMMEGDGWDALISANGKFAFRVYGEGIKDKTCTLTPYLETEEETVLGTESEEFVGE